MIYIGRSWIYGMYTTFNYDLNNSSVNKNETFFYIHRFFYGVTAVLFFSFVLLCLIGLQSCTHTHVNYHLEDIPPTHPKDPLIFQNIQKLSEQHAGKSGVYVIENGQEALQSREWLIEQAQHSIDVQYFIWTMDKTGTMSIENLIKAADRGVHVRILVDDVLVDSDPKRFAALSSNPNMEIKIYNVGVKMGAPFLKRVYNAVFHFYKANQRMHNKSITVDNEVSIIGSRNVGDEYYDLDSKNEYRDRDVLLIGDAVKDVDQNFDKFWNDPISTPVQTVVKQKKITQPYIESIRAEYLKYAQNPKHYNSEQIRLMREMPEILPNMLKNMSWEDVQFFSDIPGKNDQTSLQRGGIAANVLTKVIQQAKESIVIQSPYVILTAQGLNIFKNLHEKGVDIKISTNSLASIDNEEAYSGYYKEKTKLFKVGIQIFEYRDHPQKFSQILNRYKALQKKMPVVTLHAKSMVIDHETVYIGSFNLDPRSANLNTESGILIKDKKLAAQVEKEILTDMNPQNSWDAHSNECVTNAKLFKNMNMNFWTLFPINLFL